MYIPTVPFVPHTTVINKTIVYSDSFLTLRGTVNNLKVTVVEDVCEYSLERCLKTILQSNPNVVFHTIQYSKKNKKVYFYTKQEINTEAFDYNKLNKKITSESEICEEASNVLNSKIPNKDNNCISLYDISNLLIQLRHNYNRLIKKYELYFNNVIKSKLGLDNTIVIYGFDYKKKNLRIGFSNDSKNYDEIKFTKKMGELYIDDSQCSCDRNIFSVLESELSSLYDDIIKFVDYTDPNKAKVGIKTVNSNFNVNITNWCVSISVNSPVLNWHKFFELFLICSTGEYLFKCDSNNIHDSFKGKESEIFKKIFVNIYNCPEWSQVMLYEFRQKQLAEEQKIEDEKRYYEIKKQKRIELTRKIFPFLKRR